MQVTILSLARISFVSGSACQPSRRKKVRHRDCQKSAPRRKVSRSTSDRCDCVRGRGMKPTCRRHRRIFVRRGPRRARRMGMLENQASRENRGRQMSQLRSWARALGGAEPQYQDPPNTDYARHIWREAENIRGSIAEHYLNSRSLILNDYSDWHRVLRFHPSCPFGPDRAPAMIALMRDVMTNEPRCVQRTRLAPDGSKIARQMLGPAKGAAIKIDADHDVTMGFVSGKVWRPVSQLANVMLSQCGR
jgi:hypothetical protein